MKVWYCQLKGNGREDECPGDFERKFEVDLFPCLYEDYERNDRDTNNRIWRILFEQSDDIVWYNRAAIIAGCAAFVLFFIVLYAARDTLKEGKKGIYFVLAHIALSGAACLVGGSVLMALMNDRSDIRCKGSPGYDSDEECGRVYQCNAEKLEQENEDLWGVSIGFGLFGPLYVVVINPFVLYCYTISQLDFSYWGPVIWIPVRV